MKPLDVSSMLKPKKIKKSNLEHFGQKIEQTSHCALRNGRSGYHFCFTSDNLTDHFSKVSVRLCSSVNTTSNFKAIPTAIGKI